MSHWYASLANRLSAGQQTAAASRLADLHQRRQMHEGQFWTPHAVAKLMWAIALRAHGDAADQGLSVLDNSIGSGRLVQFVRPIDTVYGCDMDGDSIAALSEALHAGGIGHELENVGMESLDVSGVDVALINPPFSVHLESPLLTEYPCCTFGRFGPASSALSHWYALYNALAASRIVVAVVPRSVVDALDEHPLLRAHLRAIVHLPADTFAAEGANVSTSILCMGARSSQPVPVEVSGLASAWGRIAELAPLPQPRQDRVRFSTRRICADSPVITGPVTGDKRVRVYRAGRKIKLQFGCAFTHARVVNAILDYRLGFENHLRNRYPAGARYHGSARLWTEVLLSGPSPTHYLDRLCQIITDADGEADVDAQLHGYLRRRWRAVQVEKTPLQRTIYDPNGEHGRSSLDRATVTVSRNHLTDPKAFTAPMARQGQRVTLLRAADQEAERYRYDIAPDMPPLSVDQLRQLVELPVVAKSLGAWRQIEPGRAVAFPARAAHVDRRLSAAGADAWLGSWKFQRDDVIEGCLTRGFIAGHEMGAGKSRIAAGCCLAGGRHNAIVVEAGLVDEMLKQFEGFGLDPASYRVIRTLADTQALRRINLISYQTLRKAIVPGAHRTFAKILRRRFHTVCADEGSLLANTHTQQTQALYTLSPKRRIALDGTPLPNVPRNLLPLVAWTSRDGTASQPYGCQRSGAYITGELFDSAYPAERGVDRFRDQFIVTQWVTHQFADDLQSGGKREIPSLANVDLYRAFVGRHVLRRVLAEPAVAQYVSIPDPVVTVETIAWDMQHLEHYVSTAEEFVDWYRRHRAAIDSQRLNLVTVLLRLNAACRAASIPQLQEGPRVWTGGLTSKQRWCVDTLADLQRNGARTLCYFESPHTAALIASHLRAGGLSIGEYTGLRPMPERTRNLERFRDGSLPALAMTFGVGARGLNAPETSHSLFYDRMWSPRQEVQALHRAQRVGRDGALHAIYAHLEGSTDVYRAQMVDFKRDTANAGLDFATPEFEPGDFKHWMSILDEFCEQVGRQRLELVRSSARAA